MLFHENGVRRSNVKVKISRKQGTWESATVVTNLQKEILEILVIQVVETTKNYIKPTEPLKVIFEVLRESILVKMADVWEDVISKHVGCIKDFKAVIVELSISVISEMDVRKMLEDERNIPFWGVFRAEKSKPIKSN